MTYWGADLGKRTWGWNHHGMVVQVEVIRQTTDRMWEVGERKEKNRFLGCKPG